MSMLTKAEILGANDLKTQVVECPEWGGSVTIRSLTAAQVQAHGRSLFTKEVTTNGMGGKSSTQYVVDPDKVTRSDARLVSMSIVDDSGVLVFTEADVELLMAKSAAPIKRIALAQAILSGITEKAVEESEKN